MFISRLGSVKANLTPKLGRQPCWMSNDLRYTLLQQCQGAKKQSIKALT